MIRFVTNSDSRVSFVDQVSEAILGDLRQTKQPGVTPAEGAASKVSGVRYSAE
jgi:hypothetical protein